MSKFSFLICAVIMTLPLQKLFSADRAYVIDKLLVGIYETEDLNSTIVKIISTGTKLEVIQKTDQLALVVDPTGAKGWIDKSYLMAEPTSKIILNKLIKENTKNVTSNPKTVGSGETLATLKKSNTQLKAKLAGVLPEAKKCESKLSILEKESIQMRQELSTECSSIHSSAAWTKNDYMAIESALEKANMQIKKQNLIKDAKINLELVLIVIQHYWIPLMILVMLITAAAFGAGAYMFDVISRKRHGGYRL